MTDQAFRQWLADKTWVQGVRYAKAVALLLPPAALAVNIPLWQHAAQAPRLHWLLGWQVATELTALAVLLVHWRVPQLRGREWPLNIFCAVVMALATLIGLDVGWTLRPDLSLYAAGATFLAAVMCTPRPVRRPMYVLSLVAVGVAAWNSTDGTAALIAELINPFCVVVLCMELDRFTYARNVELFAEMQRAEAERARADAVLYNVLPVSIADELKRTNQAKAVNFSNLGVMFADIAGFTGFSRGLPPDALVLVLNQIFSSFDALVERHGLEKIKTIGDGYMVVSHQRLDALCSLALEMVQAIENYNTAHGTRLAMRIGMHVGPAVGGVIGVKRFLYDVWGDTVNVASRMEATGEPGAIQVTTQVYEQAGESFRFQARGALEVKGRGQMHTYWLLGPAGSR
jgi:adenylate cyclase